MRMKHYTVYAYTETGACSTYKVEATSQFNARMMVMKSMSVSESNRIKSMAVDMEGYVNG